MGVSPVLRHRRTRFARAGAVGVGILLVGVVALMGMPAAAADSRGHDDRTSEESAWTWLRSQLGTGTVVTTSSRIQPERRYPSGWTDPVAGHFVLAGVEPPTVVHEPVGGVAVYRNLSVQALVVTDTTYLIDAAPARADGTFSFPWSRPGTKVFRLVDTSTDAVLAEFAPRTGLVRSFGVDDSHPLSGRTFAYDQALALLVADSLEDRDTARLLADGLLRLQTRHGPQAGGFISSAAALNPAAGRPEYRTGIHAVATYALLRHLQSVPPLDPRRATLAAAAGRAVDWLLDQQAPDGTLLGLVTGGHGMFRDGGFDPGAKVEWASTEHNIDSWHTLTLADTVLGHPRAAATARVLDEAIMDRLWVPGEGRFLQGRTPDGPDPTEVLDVNSWGAIYLVASGRHPEALEALDHTGRFASVAGAVSGFAPRPVDPASPIVWLEGSAGVAVAQHVSGDGDGAAATLRALHFAQLPSGAYPGATRDDPYLEMTTVPSVAATAWVILGAQALLGRPSIWNTTTIEGDARS